MARLSGNQHASRKRSLLRVLNFAAIYLRMGQLDLARAQLRRWRHCMNFVPASTRRRWRCGR